MQDADSFKAEYAASDRSTCAKCRNNIAKDALRIGVMVQSTKGDFKFPLWHHFGGSKTCFEDNFMRRFAHKVTDVNQFSGIDRLKFEDQAKIKSLIVHGDQSLGAKATTAEEKQLAQESKLRWNLREKLDKEVETRELQEMLKFNDQPFEGKIFGGRPKLLDRCSDGMMFGAIPKCAVCKDGDLYFSHGEYKCTGNIDEYARCEWKGTDVERTAWKIPEDLKEEYDFLAKYKFKAREKAAAIAGTVVEKADADNAENDNKEDEDSDKKKSNKKSSTKATKSSGTRRQRNEEEDDGDDHLKNPPQNADTNTTPLVGIAVTACGKLSRTQKEIEAQVKKLGGTFVKTAAAATVCIMTEDEVGNDGKGTSKKSKDCIKGKLLCVSEDWLKEIVEEGRVVKSGDNILANEDKKKPIVRKSGAEAAAFDEQVKKSAAASRKSSAGGNGDDSNKKKSEGPIKKFIMKDGSAVHPDSGLQEKGKIYKSATGDTFNVMMTNTDVTAGTNSFYCLQLIQHEDVVNRYSIYRKWGRLGNDEIGGDKTTQYSNLASALSEFQKVFRDKTGNEWSNRKTNFKKVAGRFVPVETDLTSDAAEQQNQQGGGNNSGDAVDSSYKGPLDRPTQSLVSILFDVKTMNQTLKELEVDTEKMPLGRLSKKTIDEGFKALKDAETVLNDPNFTDADDAQFRPKIVSATNRFYTHIPHAAPLDGSSKLPLLNSAEIIKTKVEMLESLQQLEVVSKMLSTNNNNSSKSKKPGEDAAAALTDHPIDENYKKLKTNIKALDHSSEEFKRLETYVQNTHAATHSMYSLKIVDIFEVEREGEASRFKPFSTNPNRQNLFHASRLTNWASILSTGLRIAPPNAPSTGYMFGKACYFADSSSKSANYCFTTSEKTTGLMTLCEVALGDMLEKKRADSSLDGEKVKAAGCLSVKGLGRNAPDEKDAYWENNGAKTPMGKLKPAGVNDTVLLYNEYMVYDVAQIKMRYLFRLEFVYKHKFGTFH